ncbi:GTP-binding protein [Buchnera aphidicola (Cinara tujafilina)]|uniref:GTPase Era n=1 Tax=Buchnera aphidicola (Cinara tujafilina) TaxID=261317 RepID=F7WZT9_9GAMM|nr:GTPase Era [Buchnera aphidicola]AEH39752.1 GTP-binding protein [Buchnera aphidicola (Cinara tujafilina)]
MNKIKKYCGNAILVGRTNVGKSTILNRLIQKNISITSSKINTTKNPIIGIHTTNSTQSIIIDSPGLINFINNSYKKKNTYLSIFKKTNIVIFVLEAFIWTKQEQKLLHYIIKENINYIILVNKIDKIKNKSLLLPYIQMINTHTLRKKIILISAKKDKDLDQIIQLIQKYMPKNKHRYPQEIKTNYNMNFLITEIVRETLLNFFKSRNTVFCKNICFKYFKNLKNEHVINTIILVPNIRYKKIIIGNQGNKIKRCSIISRKKIENFLCMKIHFKVWVKLS